jgi:hypothetical protein
MRRGGKRPNLFLEYKGGKMKKLLGLALALASVGFASSSAEAKGAEPHVSRASAVEASAFAPQRRNRGMWDRRDNNRRVRVVTQTRLVRRGRQVWRETYEVRYLPNGATQTRLISRIRVR